MGDQGRRGKRSGGQDEQVSAAHAGLLGKGRRRLCPFRWPDQQFAGLLFERNRAGAGSTTREPACRRPARPLRRKPPPRSPRLERKNQRFEPAIERRRVSLMRACHPEPVLSIMRRTSRSIRMEIACFFAVPAGRPRRTTLRPGHDVGLLNQLLFRAGASSGSRQARFEECFFTAICFPHRDDTPARRLARPDQPQHRLPNPPDRYESRLTVDDRRHASCAGANTNPARAKSQATLSSVARAWLVRTLCARIIVIYNN